MSFNPNFPGDAGASFPFFGVKPKNYIGFPQYTEVSYPQFNQVQYPSFNDVGYPQQPKFPTFRNPTPYGGPLGINNASMINNMNKTKPKWNAFTDPYAINSLSDVLFNSTAKNKLYGIEHAWLTKTTKALFDYTNNQYIQPFRKDGGGVNQVIVNSLHAISEDFALLRNPMKGAIVEADSQKASGIVGVGAAVLGGAAIALSGPVGWGAVITGGLAAGGMAAVGTAFAKDSSAAFRGIKKGFGLGGEERTSYDFTTSEGENPNFFINLVANIALDPMLWVGAAGTLLESNVNKSMQAFLGRSAAYGTHRPEISELYQMADTLTDKLFVGTQALKRADSVYTKAVTMGNPLGLTWMATKAGGQYVYNELQLAKEMSNSIDKAYPEITKIQNIDRADAFIKNRVDDAETLERIRYNVGRIVDEDKVIVKTVSGADVVAESKDLVAFADKLPKDLSPLRAYADERASFYMEQGIKGDKFTRLLQLDLEELLLRGTVDEVIRSESADAALNFLRYIPADTPEEVLEVLVNDLMVTEAYRTLTTEGMRTGSVKLLNEVHRKLPVNTSKLEVMSVLEEELANSIGFEQGTTLAESFLMLSATETDLLGYYDPILRTVESILDNYNISTSEFKAFLAKDTSAIEKLLEYTADTSIRPNIFLNPKEYPLVPFGSQEALREIMTNNEALLSNVTPNDVLNALESVRPLTFALTDHQTYSQLHMALRNMITITPENLDDNLLNYAYSALENPKEFIKLKPPRVDEFSSNMQKDIQEFVDTLYSGKKDHNILTDKAKTVFGSEIMRIDEILELSTRSVILNGPNLLPGLTQNLYESLMESISVVYDYNPKMPNFTKEFESFSEPIIEVSRHWNTLDYFDRAIQNYEKTLKFKDFKGLEKAAEEESFDRFRYEERLARVKEALSKEPDLSFVDVYEIDYLERMLADLHTDPEILTKYAAAVEGLEQTFDSFMSSVPYNSHLVGDQEVYLEEAINALETLKTVFGGFLDEIPTLAYAELPKHKYYTLQMSKTGQMAALSNVILDKHSSFMDDLFVSHGEMRAVFDKLYEIDYGGTYLEHVYVAAREIENRLMGVRNYTDLWGAVGRIVNDNGLDPKYEYAVMDLVTNFSDMHPERFLDMMRETTSDAVRLLENTLAMVGLDPTKMSLFLPALREFAGNMASMDVDSVIYIPGRDFNRTVMRFKTGIIPEFFAGADEADDAMTAFIDLTTMSDDVLEMISRMADTQRYAQQYAVHNEHTTSMRRKLATSAIVGARDLQTKTHAEEAATKKASRDIVEAAKIRHSQHMANEIFRLESKKGEAPVYTSEDIALSSFSMNVSNLLELANPDIYLSGTTEAGIEVSKNGFTAYYNLLRSNADTLLEASRFLNSFPSSEFLEQFVINSGVTKNIPQRVAELRREDPFFARDGVTHMNQLKAEAYTKIPAEDIAREIKFNSTSGFKFFQRSLMKEGLSQEVHNELARYGIVAGATKTGTGYIIRKVIDTPAFETLEPGTTQYSTEGSEHSIMNSASYTAYTRLDDYNRKQLGIHSVFGPDLHLPIRVQANAVEQFFMLNPDIVADIGGIEVAEDFLSKTYRSRGYETDFIGDHDFMSMFVGRDPKSGNSYLPDTVFNTIYNTTLGLINHNNTKQRLLTMIDKSQYRIKDIFRASDVEKITHAFKHNPNFVGVYFKPNGKVRRIKLDNQKAVERALKENLMIVDGSTYSEMHKAFNQRNLQESGVLGNLIDKYEKNVKPLFIASAMASVGAPVRNLSDTIVKNITVTGDPEAVMDIQRAKELIDIYSQMARDLKGDVSTEYKVDRWFREKYRDKVEYARAKSEWYMVYEFLTSNASAGRLEAESDRMRRGLDDDGNIIEKKFGDNGIIRDISFENPILKPLFTAYSNVEMVSRLGLFLTLKRQDVDTPTAMQIVVDTHYDYSTRSDAELLLNDVIPFSTFPIRNFLWWADHAFDNPVLMRQFFSTSVESWTHDDRSAETISDPEDSYAKFMMMSGNPLERRNAYTTVMKLNPSFFDALTYVPKWTMDPKQKLAGPIKNMELIGRGLTGTLPEELNSEGEPKSFMSRLEIPFRAQFNRGAKILTKTIPKALSGEDEDWRFGAELIPSLFSVYKYEPKEYTKALNSYAPKRYNSYSYSGSKPYIPRGRDYGRYPSRPAPYRGPRKAYHPYPKFGTPGQYTAKGKGNRALSTGFVNKSGKFRASGGLGYGNPQHTRNMDMGISFGRYGAYLHNAPHGVQLRRLDYFDRSLYAKHYTASGNSRVANRTKKITDTKSLAFRLQDMRYNMF